MKMKKDCDNCSTLIVGKNASKTGFVLMAHSEDDGECVSQLHKMPKMHHEKGETVSFQDGTAVIPQAEETYAYIWSEFRSPEGVEFADGFLNEWGVAVASDSCIASREPKEKCQGGIGYGMRHLIAQRSRTAREGVELTAKLMKEYGYRGARAYHIADKNEAWSVQLTEGHHFAARRIGDDEVYFMPNWYTIHQIDFNDTEHQNFYWSEGLMENAVQNGWYPAGKDGSDFDFAAVYQGGVSDGPSNWERTELAWKKITGKDAMPNRTFSIKSPKKFSVEDLKNILRSHYLKYEEDVRENPLISPHRFGICRDTTVESFVVEFAEENDLSIMWRAFPRACSSPFVPWFAGMTKTARGYSWMGPKASLLSHFSADEDEFLHHQDRAYWSFSRLKNTMEFDYGYAAPMVKKSIEKMEETWKITVPEIREAYRQLAKINKETAEEFLTDWTHAQAQKAWDWCEQMTKDLVNRRNADNSAYWRNLL